MGCASSDNNVNQTEFDLVRTKLIDAIHTKRCDIICDSLDSTIESLNKLFGMISIQHRTIKLRGLSQEYINQFNKILANNSANMSRIRSLGETVGKIEKFKDSFGKSEYTKYIEFRKSYANICVTLIEPKLETVELLISSIKRHIIDKKTDEKDLHKEDLHIETKEERLVRIRNNKINQNARIDNIGKELKKLPAKNISVNKNDT